MQKEMATIEQVAQDNHERARRLMRELSQMQQEYAELKEQVSPQPRARGWSQRRSCKGRSSVETVRLAIRLFF